MNAKQKRYVTFIVSRILSFNQRGPHMSFLLLVLVVHCRKTFTCCARVYSVVGNPQWLLWHCCWSLTWYFTTHSVIRRPHSGNERKTRGGLYLVSMTTLHVHPAAVDNIHSQWSGGIIFVFIILSPKLQLNSLAIAISLTTISHWNVSCLSSLCCPLVVMVNVQ